MFLMEQYLPEKLFNCIQTMKLLPRGGKYKNMTETDVL